MRSTPGGERRHREQLANGHGAAAQQGGQRPLPDRLPWEVEVQTQTMLDELGAEIPRCLKNETVVPVRVVTVTPTEPLVDQQRQFQPQRNRSGGLQRRVFVCAESVMRPVEHELTRGSWRRIVKNEGALGQVGRQFVVIRHRFGLFQLARSPVQ